MSDIGQLLFGEFMNNRAAISFIKKAKKVHGDAYMYSIDGTTDWKVGIECKKHGEFYQRPVEHLAGHGCPLCKLQ
jgi:hypothetical protein